MRFGIFDPLLWPVDTNAGGPLPHRGSGTAKGCYGLLPIGKGQAPGIATGRGASGAGVAAGAAGRAATRGPAFLLTAGFFLAAFFLIADFLVGFFFAALRGMAFLAAAFLLPAFLLRSTFFFFAAFFLAGILFFAFAIKTSLRKLSKTPRSKALKFLPPAQRARRDRLLRGLLLLQAAMAGRASDIATLINATLPPPC